MHALPILAERRALPWVLATRVIITTDWLTHWCNHLVFRCERMLFLWRLWDWMWANIDVWLHTSGMPMPRRAMQWRGKPVHTTYFRPNNKSRCAPGTCQGDWVTRVLLCIKMLLYVLKGKWRHGERYPLESRSDLYAIEFFSKSYLTPFLHFHLPPSNSRK